MTAPAAAQQPQVKVNVLNVCAPSAEEQKELSVGAGARCRASPLSAKDYEVARGHSTLDPNTPMPGMQTLPPDAASAADWVRVRREFPELRSVQQCSIFVQRRCQNMVETLVLRVRDPKDLMQVSIEDSASAVTSASAMLATQYAGVAHQAGTVWQVVGGAGALPRRRKGVRRPIRARTNPFFTRQFGDSEPLSRCAGRAQDGAAGTGAAWAPGTSTKTAVPAGRRRTVARGCCRGVASEIWLSLESIEYVVY